MADQKLTELSEESTPISTDIAYIVDDPGGSPASKKATLANVGKGTAAGTIVTAAYASRPAAGSTGRIFLPSDGFCVERDSGAAWVPWGPIYPLAPPVVGDFTWINQGGATVDSSRGAVVMYAPANGGDSVRLLKKSAPSTPYTITIGFLTQTPVLNYFSCGLSFRQSSDGKLAVLSVSTSEATGAQISSNKFNSPTSWSANYLDLKVTHVAPWWLRIADNGTNRVCSFSHNGYDWQQFHSVGRTDFLTADEVGFFLNPNNATWGMYGTFLSWVEG